MSDSWYEQASEAISSGRLDGLGTLLSEEPDGASRRAENGTTLLHVAAESGRVDAIDLLLEHGADLEAEAEWGHTAFEWAANMNQREAALHLRARGAGRANVWLSAALGLLDEVMGFFVDGTLRSGAGRAPRPGARLDGWPEDGAFRSGDALADALYIACRNGHLDVARFLREQGADVEAIGYFGARAIHWAAGQGHGDVVDWLIDEGADPTRRDPKFDGTASGWAREFGHEALATRLASAHSGDV